MSQGGAAPAALWVAGARETEFSDNAATPGNVWRIERYRMRQDFQRHRSTRRPARYNTLRFSLPEGPAKMWSSLGPAPPGLSRAGRRSRTLGRLPAALIVGLVHLYARLWHRWSGAGPGRIPGRGAVVIAANHTSGADSAFLAAASPRPLSFLVAEEYAKIPGLHWLLRCSHSVPVRRDGRDVTAARRALRRLREGHAICVFPEGGLSNSGRPLPRRGKGGAAWLALKSGAPVVPVLICGGPSTPTVAAAWLRPSRVRLVIGQPVDLSALRARPYTRAVLEETAATITAAIAALGDHPQSPETGRSGRECPWKVNHA